MILKFILLGIIQGITEFLPVSSSGHLILFQRIIKFTENEFLFDIAVHFGTLISVIIFFRKRIYYIFKDFFLFFKNLEATRIKIPLLILIGSIPASIVGFTCSNFINSKLWNINVANFCFVITGIFLFFSEKFYKEQVCLKRLSFLSAFLIGIFQSVALLPGISRSGMTIGAGILAGLKKDDAFEFSFLLAIPVILGSFLFSLAKITALKEQQGFLAFTFLGIITACISGLVALKILKKVLNVKKLYVFSIYLWLLSTIIFILL
jgi:undecaprenyl-diphosphatase